MMDANLAIGLALVMLVAGFGVAWWHFSDDLHRQEQEIEDLEGDLLDVTEDRDEWKAQADAVQQSLELVLAEGDRDPLTAPVQLIRGAL